MDPKVIEKFWKSVEKTSTCWNWIGIRNKGGALLIWHEQFSFNAKKVSLQIHGKTVSKRIGYTCQNTRCVNPDHLISDDVARFWSKVVRFSNGCWIWTGSKSGYVDKPSSQYGIIHLRKSGLHKQVSAHKFSWELYTGRPVPKGIFLCHYCDVPLCVNPHHLWMGTIQDNTQDRHIKNRDAKGESHGRSKLDNELVRFIRQDNRTNKELAVLLSVSDTTIYYVRKGKTWKHVV